MKGGKKNCSKLHHKYGVDLDDNHHAFTHEHNKTIEKEEVIDLKTERLSYWSMV